MKTTAITCAQAKQVDLVEYLASLGHQPKKTRNHDYWYHSPLRKERTPSFKVNRKMNAWYDHGTGQGGDLIAFGTHYFNCDVASFLQLLSQQKAGQSLSFHPQQTAGIGRSAGEKKETVAGKITLTAVRPLADKSLMVYLKARGIPREIAGRFCKEVDFLLYGKQYTVIGFPNNSGGFELRSTHFKGSSTPKDSSFIDNNSDQVAVFEGFFSFLSFLKYHEKGQGLSINYLILNSLSFLERSLPLLEKHQVTHLYLDRDAAGIKATTQALKVNSRFRDGSIIYKDHKDYNEFLIQSRPHKIEESPPGKSKGQEQKAMQNPLPVSAKSKRI